MRVFHFLSKDHAFSDIRNSRIKIATICALNDPYEFYIVFTKSGQLIEDHNSEGIMQHYDSIMGFICFSKKFGNPVQWAHYADNHKGICLEFDVNEKLLIEMKYKDKPVEVDSTDEKWELQFVKATKSKYKHWEYEEEMRVAVRLDSQEIIREKELLFMPFSDSLSLKRIHTGLKCELTKMEKEELADKGITVLSTVKSQRKFEIVNASQNIPET